MSDALVPLGAVQVAVAVVLVDNGVRGQENVDRELAAFRRALAATLAERGQPDA
jgi:hypothetical protein